MNGQPFDRLRVNGGVNLLIDFAQTLGKMWVSVRILGWERVEG